MAKRMLPRWRGTLIGLLGGALDTAATMALGLRFDMGEQDVTLLVLGAYSVTFGALGYLFGLVLEGRQRDRETARIIQDQMETVAATRQRLAQAEKLAALGQLSAAIAHEVRNALAVIRSSAQELGDGAERGGGEGMRKAGAFILAEIDRLSSVVSSLLTFARPPKLRPVPVEVPALLDQAEMLVGPELEAKSIRLVRGTTETLPPVLADSDLLVQVLLDVLSNAAQAAPTGGEVRVGATPLAGRVEIAVEDSGPGVPTDIQTRIFEPFFTTRDEGTGLGLAVARQIVEAHQGQIEVGEAETGGARFSISLPEAA